MEITKKDLQEMFVVAQTNILTEVRKEILGSTTQLREEMTGMKNELREEMVGMKSELRDEMKSSSSQLHDEVKSSNAQLRDEMKSSNAQLREEMVGFKNDLEQKIEDQTRITVDIMRQEVKSEIARAKKEILDGVADLVGNGVLPQIDDHEVRIVVLEKQIPAI